MTVTAVTAVPYDEQLTAALESELRARYDDDGATHTDPAQFVPPHGLFVVAEVDGVRVACGGWRTLEPGVGEVKRMYVAPSHRGQGLSRKVLRALVADAQRQGMTRLVLETGPLQPEAIGLYTASGFVPTEPYGEWVDDPGASLFFVRHLPVVRAVRYEEAAELAEAMNLEMQRVYESDEGASPASAADFAPPGVFLVASLDGTDVACGGLRLLAPGRGEVKRMYTDPSVRGLGVARVLLRALLDHARAQGLEDVWLETGTRQPDAIALYLSEGFTPIPPYGHYADHPETLCYALRL